MDTRTIETLLTSFRPAFLQRDLLVSTRKGPSDFVTELDVHIEHSIKEALLAMYPEDGFLGEESLGQIKKRTWILDPIDGTMNYMLDYHMSVISLALYEDGQVVYGWIYHPYLDEMYYAKLGEGSFLNGKRISVSQRPLAQGVITVGSSPYLREYAHQTMQILEKLFAKSLDFRRSGSAAYDLACVASGRMDGFYELDLRPWDYAAGMLLVREAGGIITSLDGRQLVLQDHQAMIAGNPNVHPLILNIIQEVMTP